MRFLSTKMDASSPCGGISPTASHVNTSRPCFRLNLKINDEENSVTVKKHIEANRQKITEDKTPYLSIRFLAILSYFTGLLEDRFFIVKL